jgi:hypothetical protein
MIGMTGGGHNAPGPVAEPGYCNAESRRPGTHGRLEGVWGHRRAAPHQGFESPPVPGVLFCRDPSATQRNGDVSGRRTDMADERTLTRRQSMTRSIAPRLWDRRRLARLRHRHRHRRATRKGVDQARTVSIDVLTTRVMPVCSSTLQDAGLGGLTLA